MTGVTRKYSGIKQAEIFIDAVGQDSSNLYLAISHSDPWANDSAPPIPNDSRLDTINFWRRMIGGKKLTAFNMCQVVPRINWAANTVYTPYIDTDPNIFSKNFYVVTTDFNVYKCLDNNFSANSTVMPTYTSFDRTNTEADGYTWVYLYSVRTADRIRFMNSNWLPCRYITDNDGSLQFQVEKFAIDGSINTIIVTNPGVGYTNTQNISIAITGDGIGLSATPSINVSSQTVSNIIVTSPGSDYHFSNVAIIGGGGSGATANAIITPYGGHGFDAINELGASNIMINISLKNSELGKLSVQNDFRQIGIIDTPVIYGSTTPLSNTSFNQSTKIQVSSVGTDYQLDEYVFQGGSLDGSTFSGRVLDWDSPNNIVSLTESRGIPITDRLIGTVSGTSRFLINTTNPDIKPFVGRLLYVENFPPIQRNLIQTESIQVILQFGQ